MKKKYTKKQITEAIVFWEKQLKKMNESSVVDGIDINVTFGAAKPDLVSFWSLDQYDFGIKASDSFVDVLRQWKTEIEKYYHDYGFDVEVVSMQGPVHYDNEFNVSVKCKPGCDFDALKKFNTDQEL